MAGFRGAPAGRRRALADILNRLSRLADDFPELAELDLNPVLGLPDRAVVVDARIRLARPRLAPTRRAGSDRRDGRFPSPVAAFPQPIGTAAPMPVDTPCEQDR